MYVHVRVCICYSLCMYMCVLYVRGVTCTRVITGVKISVSGEEGEGEAGESSVQIREITSMLMEQ